MIDCRLDQMVVELHLEDQWHNPTVGASTNCPHISFQRRLEIP
jgi:hypothetical protein